MTALDLLKNRAGANWLFLVAVLVLGIAAIKVRLVGLDFMELRHAPIPLRAAFETYCIGMWALLSALYLWL